MGISLDPKREQQIRNLLDSTERLTNYKLGDQIKSENCKNEVKPGPSDKVNSFENRYSHISDSSFKQKFLQSITGSIETNLQNSLLVRTALVRDEQLDMVYKEELLNKQRSKNYQKMMNFRQKLPSYKMQDEILEFLYHNQVIVISGETGKDFCKIIHENSSLQQLFLCNSVWLTNKICSVKFPRRRMLI